MSFNGLDALWTPPSNSNPLSLTEGPALGVKRHRSPSQNSLNLPPNTPKSNIFTSRFKAVPKIHADKHSNKSLGVPVESAPRASSFNNLLNNVKGKDSGGKKNVGGKLKQLFSTTGGAAGDKLATVGTASSSKTNSLTRSSIGEKKNYSSGGEKRNGTGDANSWSESEYDEDEGDLEDDAIRQNYGGESGEDSDCEEWMESHSDNGAARLGSVPYGERKKIITAVGGRAVATSKKFPKKLKKAFLNLQAKASASSSSLGGVPEGHTTVNNVDTPPSCGQGNEGNPQITLSDGGRLRRLSGNARNPDTMLRRASVTLSDTPLVTKNMDRIVKNHKPLQLSTSTTAVVSEKDRIVQQTEKLFLKTLKETKKIQRAKADLEGEMTPYRRDARAEAILHRYQDKLSELKLVLEGYADKLESYDPRNELLLKNASYIRKRSNSVSNTTTVSDSKVLISTSNNQDLPNSNIYPRRVNKSLPDAGKVTQAMSGSREEMEHPTEGSYHSDLDIKALQDEVQLHVRANREELNRRLEELHAELSRRITEVADANTLRCTDTETNINTLLTGKFSELDYDLRERNEIVEQQMAALSEDIRTIDQRTAHRIMDIEQTYNDRLSALEARLGDIEKSQYNGSPNKNFVEDLQDADLVTLAKRILQSFLVFLISFIFVFMNILKVFSITISTPARTIGFVFSITFVIVAYLTRESTILWINTTLGLSSS